MNKKVLAVGIAFLIVAAGLVFLLLNSTAEQSWTEAEASERIGALYGGEVDSVTEAGNAFQVEFTKQDGLYRAIVSKEGGTVESVELIEAGTAPEPLTEDEAKEIAAAETGGTAVAAALDEQNGAYDVQVEKDGASTTVTISTADGEVLKMTNEPEEAEPETPTALAPGDAVEIAKQYLDGVVDDVDFEGTDDGGYYLVTIEKDETDQEVTVQIHAIRGEVMTVEWDD